MDGAEVPADSVTDGVFVGFIAGKLYRPVRQTAFMVWDWCPRPSAEFRLTYRLVDNQLKYVERKAV